jgi:hypothetical protein
VTFDIHIRAPKRRRPLPRLTAVDSLEAKATVMTLMDNCLSTSSPSARNNAAALTPVHTPTVFTHLSRGIHKIHFL